MFCGSHKLPNFYNNIVELHWPINIYTVVSKHTMLLARFMSLVVNVADEVGTFIILVIIYTTVKQNGILGLVFPVSISWFCVHVTPSIGEIFLQHSFL
jgi:hypothetical protein